MNITIPKTEYTALKKDEMAYRKLSSSIFKKTIKDPAKDTVADFRKTNLYSEDFLKDLEKGLEKSTYGR